jgi:acyl carrier protein
MSTQVQDVTETDIQLWCAAYLRKALRLKHSIVDINADFAGLGLDSAESVFLVSAIEDWLGLELSSETAIEHRTIANLAHFVACKLEGQVGTAKAEG